MPDLPHDPTDPGPVPTGHVQPDDDELLTRLGRALDAGDPVPGAASALARNLLRWRSDHADLATLGLVELAPVRSGATLQVHRFTLGEVEIELTVDGNTVTGLIDPWPPGPGRIQVRVETLDQTIEPEVDQGELEVDLDGDGVFRLVVSSDDGRIRTGWLRAG